MKFSLSWLRQHLDTTASLTEICDKLTSLGLEVEGVEEVEADRVIKDIASALPYDNPEKTFQTMIAWGRYAGLMDINNKTRMVFVPEEDEEVAAGDTRH